MLRIITISVIAVVVSLVYEAKADCVKGEANRVATVTVTSCTSTAEVARRRLGDVNLPWVRTHVDGAVQRSRGIVVAGRIVEKIHVAQFSDTDFRFLDVEASDETAEWFVRGESLSCDAFAPESVVQIYATNRCCDVFPPMDIPCLLGVEQAEAVGEPLRRFLETAGFQAPRQ